MGNENTQRNVVVNGEKESWVIFGLWARLFWRNHFCNPIQISACFTRTCFLQVFSKPVESFAHLIPCILASLKLIYQKACGMLDVADPSHHCGCE